MNSNVGGACGEIAVYKGKNWKYLLNPLGKFRTPFQIGWNAEDFCVISGSAEF